VLIADDHALLRDGLRRLIAGEADLEVAGEAADGREALEKIASLRPDVVLLDLAMPLLNGTEVARSVRTNAPGTRVVVVTMHQEEEFIFEAVRAGVNGYVLKDASAEELLGAVRAAARGERYFASSIARVVEDTGAKRGAPERPPSQRLTGREREVLQLLAEGKSVPEIATLIGISRKTVDVHKTRLMKKLDIHNRASLVRYAIANKVVAV